jgi:hypothetical protein
VTPRPRSANLRRPTHTYGRLAPLDGPVIVGINASADASRLAGGWLATSGHYGARARPFPVDISGPNRTTVAELHVALWALSAVCADIPRGMTLRTSSQTALRFLTMWQRGGTVMPDGYRSAWRSDGRAPALNELQLLVEHTPALHLEHASAETEGLVATADSLARLALRYSKGMVQEESEVTTLARTYAQRDLPDYRTPRE